MARKPHLWLALHEAAHAVARFVLVEAHDGDCPALAPKVEKITLRDGHEHSDGCVWWEANLPHFDITEPLDLTEPSEDPYGEDSDWLILNARRTMVELMAGPLAEVLALRHFPASVHASLTEDHDDDDSDRGKVRALLRWLNPTDKQAELQTIAEATSALVHVEWPGLIPAARVLRTAGEMSGKEFERAWRAVRPDPATRMQRWDEWRHDWRRMMAESDIEAPEALGVSCVDGVVRLPEPE